MLHILFLSYATYFIALICYIFCLETQYSILQLQNFLITEIQISVINEEYCIFFFIVSRVFKRLTYSQTACCYGSKSVMQRDALSKCYLWDKISFQTNRTQNNSDRYQFQNIASGSNCLARFSQFKVNKKQTQKVFEI